MKRRFLYNSTAIIASLVLAVQLPSQGLAPVISSYAYTARSGKVNADNLNVRSGPGTSYPVAGKLGRGAAVTVVGETSGEGRKWYQIQFAGSGGAQVNGYVASEYIRFPVAYQTDAGFEQYLNNQGFPESYKDGLREIHAQYPNWVFTAQHTGLDWNTVIQNESVIGRSLVHKSSISSWKSTADGAYDWGNDTWPVFDGGSWVAASEGILSYYMDPRNFLDEVSVFQFLVQSYDASAHTADGLRTMVKGTFLEGGSPGAGDAGGGSAENGDGSGGDGGGPVGTPVTPVGPIGPGVTPATGESSGQGSSVLPPDGGGGGDDSQAPVSNGNSGVSFEAPQLSRSGHQVGLVATGAGPGVSPSPGDGQAAGGGQSYVDILMRAGQESGVNPYVLAAMIIQEQGGSGGSGSISGTAAGYEGYYNFFNIEAYQAGGMSPVQRGLWYASQSGSYGRPWNTPEKSIMGGASFYGTNYVKVGQDTFYLKKYNVQGANLYKHQYMTNVQGAASEASKMAQAYNGQMKQSALQFKIPVFLDMPGEACPKPTGDGSPNNKLRTLGIDGFTLTPTFDKDTLSYDLIVDQSVSQIQVQAQAINSAASVEGAGAISLQSGGNDIKVTVRAQNGNVREYTIHVVRQDGGQSGSGGQGPGGGNTAPAGSGPVITPIG